MAKINFSLFNCDKLFWVKYILVPMAALLTGSVNSTQVYARDIAYCSGVEKGTPKCKPVKILRIPYSYFASNPEKQDQLVIQKLEVAYPTMRPWSEIPFIKRWRTEKTEISIRQISSSAAEIAFEGAFLGNPKPVQFEDLYGLTQYRKSGWGTNQILVRLDSQLKVFIQCSFSDHLSVNESLRCEVNENTEWGLSMQYSYNRKLLPSWKDVHVKVNELINSFSVVHSEK